MLIVAGVNHLQNSLPKSVVTIGNFDGLHVGHRALVEKTVSWAKEKGAQSVVMSFKPHPMKVLFPEREIHRLFSFEDQEDQLRTLGTDIFIQQPFSRELSEMAPERFLSEILLKPLNPMAIVVGYDFAFGANREGSIGFLEKFCAGAGIELYVESPIRVGSEIISSSLVRKLVSEGNMSMVSKCLLRDFYVEGIVEKGAGRGKQIGFPTANVFTKAETLPAIGVYATRSFLNNQIYPSITNVGKNPTFAEENRRPIQIETHILDFDQDIYGDSMRVEFIDYIRSETKFSSVADLIKQIGLDVEKVKEFHDKMGSSKSI